MFKTDPNLLSSLILEKIGEQVERAEHLIALLSPDKISWQPAADTARVGDLLGHLLECMAGFCATLYGLDGERLAHFSRLRELQVNHFCGIDEALARLREYMTHIEQGFAVMTDDKLGQKMPTVFVSDGEAVLTILLGNLEHFINHKYQLFFYLKMLGVPVGTSDLYHLRGV